MDRMDEAIFEFAYRMALDDATGQKAYKSRGDGSKTRLRRCYSARQAVKKYISDIFDKNGKPDFDGTVRYVMDAFEEFLAEEEDGSNFTFGNAQKLINMTAKYMFMATYGRPGLRERFTQCHCPMDSVMIEEIIKMLDNRADIRERHDLLKRGWKGKLRTPAWSTIEKAEDGYDLFQSIVDSLRQDETVLNELEAPEGLSRLEFDFYIWGQNNRAKDRATGFIAKS